MKTTRKEDAMASKLLCSTAATLALAAAVLGPAEIQAQPYPSRDIRFVCAFPPGSGADVLVRYFANAVQKLSPATIIVENKSGAAGLIAAEYVARSKPDGYTVFVHGSSGISNILALYKKPPIDPYKAVEVVGTINRQPFMIVVDPKSPYKTIAQLTEAMLKKGEKATYAVSATTGAVVGEIYKARTGIKAVQVSYKTASDSLIDQLAGRLDYAAMDPQYSMAMHREGKLRILAVSTGERLQANPDLPTMREQGVDMDVYGWFAAMVPAGTPAAAKTRLNEWFVKVVSSPETKAFLNQFGGDPLVEAPELAQKRLLRDIDSWKEWARIAKIVPQ
jgi:tripartite-type tricarboxylate transporter receptor subunit TctC